MAAKETFTLNDLVRDILNLSSKDSEKYSRREIQASLKRAINRDYPAALRRQFDSAELQEIVAEMRRHLPELNNRLFGIKDTRMLGRIADEMGATLQAESFDEPDGWALRGFYVDGNELLKRPLIGLNTSNHPVAVAAAFWHEIGHHLMNR